VLTSEGKTCSLRMSFTTYTGQFDPASGGTVNGVAWIHAELQGIAVLPVMPSLL
jgi:hypothetical protein